MASTKIFLAAGNPQQNSNNNLLLTEDESPCRNPNCQFHSRQLQQRDSGSLSADEDHPSAAPPALISPTPQLVDADGVPIPTNFMDLVRLIRLELGPHFGLMDSDKIDLGRLTALMNNFDATKKSPNSEHNFDQFCFHDDFRYTRNLVADGNGKYNLLLLCWGPGQVSPVHDHSGSHCLLKVVEGELTETRYKWPVQQSDERDPKQLQVTDEFTMRTNQVAYMHDNLGLHRVGNKQSTPSISLHLYSPPIEVCHTFCTETGRSRQGGKCVFFSAFGKRSQQQQ